MFRIHRIRRNFLIRTNLQNYKLFLPRISSDRSKPRSATQSPLLPSAAGKIFSTKRVSGLSCLEKRRSSSSTHRKPGRDTCNLKSWLSTERWRAWRNTQTKGWGNFLTFGMKILNTHSKIYQDRQVDIFLEEGRAGAGGRTVIGWRGQVLKKQHV